MKLINCLNSDINRLLFIFVLLETLSAHIEVHGIFYEYQCSFCLEKKVRDKGLRANDIALKAEMYILYINNNIFFEIL